MHSLALQSDVDLVRNRLNSEAWKAIDGIEEKIADHLDPVELPVQHIFTPGAYTRKTFLPKGTLLTTRIHLTEHPFAVLTGTMCVFTEEKGWVCLEAGYLGVTQPGTRRLIYANEDTWVATFHVTDLTDPDAIGRELTFSEGKYADMGIAAQKLKQAS